MSRWDRAVCSATHDTTCYSWDPLDDKLERFSKSEYLIFICECMKPVPVEKYFDVGHRPQTITWHVFAVKPIVNQTVQLD